VAMPHFRGGKLPIIAALRMEVEDAADSASRCFLRSSIREASNPIATVI